MKFDELNALCDDERLMVKAEGGDRAVLCKRPDATLRSGTFNGRVITIMIMITIGTCYSDAAETNPSESTRPKKIKRAKAKKKQKHTIAGT